MKYVERTPEEIADSIGKWSADYAYCPIRTNGERDTIIAALRALSSLEPTKGQIEDVRRVIVLAIAFLTRDVGTDRITKTVNQVVEKLVAADAVIRALPLQERAAPDDRTFRFTLEPMGTVPASITQARDLYVHEGSFAVVYGTNAKAIGWIDMHALFKDRVYRHHLLPVAPMVAEDAISEGK